jgi:hypothetical protein
MALVLLVLFAPNGVGAPIAGHHNSSRRAAVLLPTLATEGIIIIPSVASLLSIARSLSARSQSAADGGCSEGNGEGCDHCGGDGS